MAEPVRHRQTKEAATDMFDLQSPRHIPTLPNLESRRQTAWVARPFCANNPNTVSWGGILKGLPLRGAPASGGGMPIACGVDCALSLDLFLLKRFFSLSLFLLLDEPQPRETNGEDHHHDQNGVLNHRSDPELMLTDQRRPK